MNILSSISAEFDIAEYMKNIEKETYIDNMNILSLGRCHYTILKKGDNVVAKSDETLTVAKYNVLFNIFKDIIERRNKPFSNVPDKLYEILLPGIIMFSLMMEYALELNHKYPDHFRPTNIGIDFIENVIYYDINMKSLSDLRFMHTYFQLSQLGLYDTNDFIRFYRKHKEIFDYLANFYEVYTPNVLSQINVQSAGDEKKKLKIRKSLKTNVKKVSVKKFKKYLGSGSGFDGDNSLNTKMENSNLPYQYTSRIDRLTGKTIIYEESEKVRIEIEDLEKLEQFKNKQYSPRIKTRIISKTTKFVNKDSPIFKKMQEISKTISS